MEATRLDEPDPVAAWQKHIDRLVERAGVLNERAFDAVRFRGPGTDLTVGLMREAEWYTAAEETIDGRRHVVNMPTEEVYTTPPTADGGNRPLDAAARGRRHDRARPRDPVRRRPRSRGPRQLRR